VDLDRATKINKHFRLANYHQQRIAKLVVERLVGIEARPEELLTRYDALAAVLPTFQEKQDTEKEPTETNKHSSSRSCSLRTPILSVTESEPPFIRLSMYTPSEANLNNSEISAFWTIYPEGSTWDQSQTIKTFTPELIKRDWFNPDKPQFQGYLGEGSDEKRLKWLKVSSSLEEIEKSFKSYADLAFELTPQEARAKKFSDVFIEILEGR
jgi:hypothetical protein